LLEGVAHGWHEGRILKFFTQLGERGKPKLWVGWLERFGAKVLASPSPNLPLAARLLRLGELANSFPAIQPIGRASYQIGRQLYAREAESVVWEYEGPDGQAAATPPPEVAFPTSSLPLPEGTTTLTLEELAAYLQENASLAAQMAAQLGTATAEPQAIIEALIDQFQATQGELATEPETAEGWSQRGLQQANGGDLTGAIASWDKALELEPSFARAWHNRGSALGNLGRLEEAIASFDRALELKPDDPQTWNFKGNACYNLQRLEEALACWDKVVELQPNFSQAWFNRGIVAEQLGRKEEAIASFRQALAVQPDFELAKAKLEDLSTDTNW
jgi:tetratricopeptide (TPR) repeat protein